MRAYFSIDRFQTHRISWSISFLFRFQNFTMIDLCFYSESYHANEMSIVSWHFFFQWLNSTLSLMFFWRKKSYIYHKLMWFRFFFLPLGLLIHLMSVLGIIAILEKCILFCQVLYFSSSLNTLFIFSFLASSIIF